MNEVIDMNECSVYPGMRLANKDGTVDIRVIYVDGKMASVCNLNSSNLEIYYCSSLDLIQNLCNNIFHEIKEELYIVETEKLPKTDLQNYERNKEIAKRIEAEYGPDYVSLSGKGKKPAVAKILNDCRVSKATFWRVVNQYIRSGLRESSLVNQRYVGKTNGSRNRYVYSAKTGRPAKYSKGGKILNEDDYVIFDKFIKRYVNSPNVSFASLYVDLINEYYSTDQMQGNILIHTALPDDQKPTYNQFYYYLHKNITPQQKKKSKMGRDQYRNDARILTGSSMDGVMGPADCVEIDAHEMDVSLVSREDHTSVIGRPILYIIIDIFTRIILAVSVAFDNNSVVGLTNAFFNLSEDKDKLLKKYAIIPFNFVPLKA